jgi:hypothetical protein
MHHPVAATARRPQIDQITMNTQAMFTPNITTQALVKFGAVPRLSSMGSLAVLPLQAKF